MLLAVVDTKVVVSGVLAGTGDSPNREIVDAMLAARLHFILSEDLLAEYRRVLLRPAIAQRHGLREGDVDAVLEGLVLNAGFRDPGPADQAAAPGEDPRPVVAADNHVIALLAEVADAALVTGDRRLAQAVAPWRTVLAPAELAQLLP